MELERPGQDPLSVKLWARRVWTLELSLVSPINVLNLLIRLISLDYSRFDALTVFDHLF